MATARTQNTQRRSGLSSLGLSWKRRKKGRGRRGCVEEGAPRRDKAEHGLTHPAWWGKGAGRGSRVLRACLMKRTTQEGMFSLEKSGPPGRDSFKTFQNNF
jgi:hypothetical protein